MRHVAADGQLASLRQVELTKVVSWERNHTMVKRNEMVGSLI